ncbi:MAG: MATE family efflux transporter [Chloroflexia bacterium]|nr:MATE family efflux transporter [Chloroflexia bacterium]
MSTTTRDDTTTTDTDASALAASLPPIAPAATPAMTQRRVLGLALPIIGENILQTAVGVVDTFFVAQLGAVAVAGVGVALEIVFFMIAILSSVAIGGTILVAQAIGAGRKEDADRRARQTVLWGFFLVVPISVLVYAGAPVIVAAFRTEADVAAEATTFLRVTGATSVALLMTFVCGAVLRGAGDSRSPLAASLVANAVNVVLAWLLIFGNLGFPRLEVAGSAWASAIGRGVGAAILLWLLFSGRRAVSIRGRAGWRPRLPLARDLARLGVPAAIEQMVMTGGITVLVVIVALIGTAALAAQQITFTALSLALLPGMGFATAATALVGQSIGAARPDAARAAARIATVWSVVWMTAGAVLYLVFAEAMMRVFTDNDAVVAQGEGALWAMGISLPLLAVSSVAGGALRGSGDTRTPMVTRSISTWLAVALAWVWVAWFDGSLTAVWLAFLATAPIATIGNSRAFTRRLRAAERAHASDHPIEESAAGSP